MIFAWTTPRTVTSRSHQSRMDNSLVISVVFFTDKVSANFVDKYNCSMLRERQRPKTVGHCKRLHWMLRPVIKFGKRFESRSEARGFSVALVICNPTEFFNVQTGPRSTSWPLFLTPKHTGRNGAKSSRSQTFRSKHEHEAYCSKPSTANF